MRLYLVECKDGKKWVPMGLQKDEGNEVLFTDGPFTLFKTEAEAIDAMELAASYHEDEVYDYRLKEVVI